MLSASCIAQAALFCQVVPGFSKVTFSKTYKCLKYHFKDLMSISAFVVTLVQWLIASEEGKLFISVAVYAVLVEVKPPRVSRWCLRVLHTTDSLFG